MKFHHSCGASPNTVRLSKEFTTKKHKYTKSEMDWLADATLTAWEFAIKTGNWSLYWDLDHAITHKFEYRRTKL